jgi:hypothetical protein
MSRDLKARKPDEARRPSETRLYTVHALFVAVHRFASDAAPVGSSRSDVGRRA